MWGGSKARKTLAAFAVLVGLAAPVSAADRPAVVELFTSQGCSSCPPADALLGRLAQERSDLIVLSLPVDIWDYTGWKDTLARPEFTTRQKNYAHSRGDHQVYTPQIVVDGVAHCVGSDRRQLNAILDSTAAARRDAGADMRVSEKDGMVVVDLGAGSGLGEGGHGAGVWLLRIARSKAVTIGRGENGGRQITYTNVVRSMVRMGQWMGQAARFEIPVPEARSEDSDAYVVIVQKSWGEVLGPILAAGKSPNF